MSYPHHRAFATLALALPLLAVSATGSAPASDGLSGTWQVSRTCLTVCVSPKPVRKVVSHLKGDLFTTNGQTPQVLYHKGKQVLVHSAKESLVLAIKAPGQLMSGFGVGADGSTFQSTWRCIASAGSAAVPSTTLTSVTTTQPAHTAMGMTVC